MATHVLRDDDDEIDSEHASRSIALNCASFDKFSILFKILFCNAFKKEGNNFNHEPYLIFQDVRMHSHVNEAVWGQLLVTTFDPPRPVLGCCVKEYLGLMRFLGSLEFLKSSFLMTSRFSYCVVISRVHVMFFSLSFISTFPNQKKAKHVLKAL